MSPEQRETILGMNDILEQWKTRAEQAGFTTLQASVMSVFVMQMFEEMTQFLVSLVHADLDAMKAMIEAQTETGRKPAQRAGLN